MTRNEKPLDSQNGDAWIRWSNAEIERLNREIRRHSIIIFILDVVLIIIGAATWFLAGFLIYSIWRLAR